MLNINREQMSKLASEELKKQRNLLIVLAVLLFVGGIFCLINPMLSGIAVSTILGILFIMSGLAILVSTFSSSLYSGWSKIFSFVIGVAYCTLGYSFIKDPIQSLVLLAIFVSVLFIIGGVVRLYVGFQQIKTSSGWLQILIGILDFVIAFLLIGNGPLTSITLLTTLIGIEMLFSAFSLFTLLSILKKNQS